MTIWNEETSEEKEQSLFPTTTSCAQDFLANLSRLLESEEVSKILEAHYSLKYVASCKLSDPHIFSLRTSKDSFLMTVEEHLEQSSPPWTNLGMGINGKCLTLKCGSLKIEREYSLSDILEKNPSQKYFLSEKAVKGLIAHQKRHKEMGHGFGANVIELQEHCESEAQD